MQFSQVKRDPAKAAGTPVTAMVNVKVQDFMRQDYFDEPLKRFMAEVGAGQVLRCRSVEGTAQDGVAYCEFEFLVIATLEGTLDSLVSELQKMGAPKGSLLIDPTGRRRDRTFGKAEGLALYLPDNTPIHDLIERLELTLADSGTDGALFDHWDGPAGQAVYFYGRSYDQMAASMASVLRDGPPYKMSRIA
ncbi:hypothetical protein [Jannaschia pohangensis]|nr:hypothetical protein [Jannaschia pohangensis]